MPAVMPSNGTSSTDQEMLKNMLQIGSLDAINLSTVLTQIAIAKEWLLQVHNNKKIKNTPQNQS